MVPDFIRGFEYINGLPLEKLIDRRFLENEFLLTLGLNDEQLDQMPTRYADHYGKGFGWRIWQYPSQFTDYLLYLARHAKDIDSYVEIGCRFGGTFATVACYLRRLNGNFNTAVAIDLIEEPALIAEMRRHLPIEFLRVNSRSPAFRDWAKVRRFDLAFIDGDHDFLGVLNDFEILKDRAKHLVFHDVGSRACPGVVTFWDILKTFWSGPEFRIEEYCQQYEDVPVAGPYLGIGCVERK
jgi:hypothetical protein